MRTQLMIMVIVGAVFLVAVAIVVGLVVWLGWLGGLVAALVMFGVLVGLYVWVMKPWHSMK